MVSCKSRCCTVFFPFRCLFQCMSRAHSLRTWKYKIYLQHPEPDTQNITRARTHTKCGCKQVKRRRPNERTSEWKKRDSISKNFEFENQMRKIKTKIRMIVYMIYFNLHLFYTTVAFFPLSLFLSVFAVERVYSYVSDFFFCCVFFCFVCRNGQL